MSDYIALRVIKARHADLLREADEARLARICRSQQRKRHRPGRTVSWLWHGQPRPSAATGSEGNGSALAAHAAVAIAASHRVQVLTATPDSRTVVDQAQGILMARYGLTADQALSLLQRASRVEELRLDLVAETLVRTGQTPGVSFSPLHSPTPGPS